MVVLKIKKQMANDKLQKCTLSQNELTEMYVCACVCVY